MKLLSGGNPQIAKADGDEDEPDTTVRRAPSTGLFVSTDLKLGEESELFKDLKE